MNRESLIGLFQRGGWERGIQLENLFMCRFCVVYLYDTKFIIGGNKNGLNFNYIAEYKDIDTIDVSDCEVDIYFNNNSEITIELY